MTRLISIGLLWGITVVEFFAIAIVAFRRSFFVNHDAALYLQCGQLILEGKTPYVDFYDNNPPLIMYLNTLPVMFSNLTGLSVMQAFAALVLLSILVSTFTIAWIMARAGLPAIQIQLFLSAWLSLNLMTLYFQDFGQREHLFMIFATPFLLSRLIRHDRDFLQHRILYLLLIGFSAAVGATLKPYFLVTILLAEMFYFIKIRSKRFFLAPELIGFVLFCLAYGLVFLFSPLMRTSYLEVLAPLISKGNSAYYAYRIVIVNCFNPLFGGFSAYNFILSAILMLQVGFVLFGSRASSKLSLASTGFLIMSIASLFSFIYQAKAWPYQIIPFQYFVVYGLIWNFGSIGDWVRTVWASRYRFWERSIGVIISLNLVGFLILANRLYTSQAYWDSQFYKVIKETSAINNRVVIVSSSMLAYPYLLQADKRPGSRFLWFFPVAMLYSQAHDPNLTESEIYQHGSLDKELENRFMNELSSDIETLQPALMLINSGYLDQALPGKFNLKNYLRARNIMGQIESNYRFDSEIKLKNGVQFELWILK